MSVLHVSILFEIFDFVALSLKSKFFYCILLVMQLLFYSMSFFLWATLLNLQEGRLLCIAKIAYVRVRCSLDGSRFDQ